MKTEATNSSLALTSVLKDLGWVKLKQLAKDIRNQDSHSWQEKSRNFYNRGLTKNNTRLVSRKANFILLDNY